MKQKFLTQVIIFVIAFSFTAITLSAQVTVGSPQSPVSGALLDLKEEGTTTKGLGLPRVKLNSMVIPSGKSLAQTIDGTKTSDNWNSSDHIGLIVYHASGTTPRECARIPDGLYVWSGSQWENLGNKGGDSYMFADSRDGETYWARNFGSTAGDWMLENLRYVPKVADGYNNYVHSATYGTDKYYAYPEKNESPYVPNNHPSAEWEVKYKKNGLLYNWPAAINMGNGGGLETPDPGNINQGQGELNELTVGMRGICPEGWHLPSDKEWNDLEREIYNNAHLYSTYTETEVNAWAPWESSWETTIYNSRPTGYPAEAHGAAMKSPCPPHNSAYSTAGKSLPGGHGGFDVLLIGQGWSGRIEDYGFSATLWSASKRSAGYPITRYMDYAITAVNRGQVIDSLALHAVRCKKD